MISVQKVFNRVRDLSRKDKAGYMSSEEFNRDLSEAQTLLMDYYYKMFEQHQRALDSLEPFIKVTNLPILNQFCEFPTDYRHKLEAGYCFTKNSTKKAADCDIANIGNNCIVGNPTVDVRGMQHLNSNEVLKTLSSSIRKPKINLEKGTGKFAYELVNNKIKVYPKELNGFVQWKYIADPTEALYNTTLDIANQEEDFNPTDALINPSVDLAWNEQEQPQLVSLMLMFKGIEVRETALIQWVMQQHQYSNRQ